MPYKTYRLLYSLTSDTKAFLDIAQRDDAHLSMATSIAKSERNWLLLLSLLQENRCDKKWLGVRIINVFARQGFLPGLKEAHRLGYDWDDLTSLICVKADRSECLQFGFETGCKMHDRIADHAARHGSLACLLLVLQYHHIIDERTSEAATSHGLSHLRTVRERDCPWDDKTILAASEAGRLNCLRYAHENDCPWHENTTAAAIENGHVDCLYYAYENDCPWHADVTKIAARQGELDWLEYADAAGCPWHKDTTAVATENGYFECLRYAVENGCPWHPDVTEIAVRYGQMDCLHYAHENGCTWHKNTTAVATENGDLECLRYAHENGCPWHPDVTEIAARHGRMDCLRYAHENGCPWHEKTTAAASREGYLECLRYAHEHGCPWDSYARAPDGTYRSRIGVCEDRIMCREYAKKMGCEAWRPKGLEHLVCFGRDDISLCRTPGISL